MVVESASMGREVADRRGVRYGVPVALMFAAGLGWWWSARMASDMRAGGSGEMMMSKQSTVSVAGFMVAWLAMMAAMMLPAVTPVVKLYALAASRRRVAPLPYFVAGYLTVWLVLGVPAYVAWRALDMPLTEGAGWAARVAGGVFVAAGVWQLTPLKILCLRHCRSPMSFFLRYGGRLERPVQATRMGASHGLFCVGCCWAMFAVLVAVGTMNLGWMLILTALIATEKIFRRGERIAAWAGGVFVVLGAVLLAWPGTMDAVT